MKKLNLLAFDLGASNGRGILGEFDGQRIQMRELHRFENNYIDLNGMFYWDILNMFHQMKQAILAFKKEGLFFGPVGRQGGVEGRIQQQDKILFPPIPHFPDG